MYPRSEVLKWKKDNNGWSICPENPLVKIKIGAGASIGAGTSIGDRAVIGAGASIGDRAVIGNGAKIGVSAVIGYDVRIDNEVKIGYGAKIGDRATILKSPLQIQGTRHLVIYAEGLVQIGCYRMSIADWERKGKKIAEKEGYTAEEIKEYERYLKWIKEIGK
ncbi:MAG: acyl-ACP--UDP-N- acetylglucosamine O-acyltransferase [Candidatus Helarchaeota archaeon]